MGLRYIEFPDEDYVELIADGPTSAAELRDFIARFDRFAAARERVSLLELAVRISPGERGTVWEAMRFRVRNIRRLDRLGVVTRSRWLRLALALLDPVVPANVRTFTFDREQEARDWVRG